MELVSSNITSLISLLALLSISVLAQSEVLWRGDFETGTTEQWPGAPKSEAVKVVQEPVRAGKFAVRIDGTNAARRKDQDRIEFQYQPKPPGTAEGTERYFSWSVYLSAKLTPGHHSMGYFEVRNAWTQLMAFEAEGEDVTTARGFRMPADGLERKAHARPLARLRRPRFLVPRPSEGFVEVWFDGEKVVPLARTATLRDENPAFLQVGFFRQTSEVPETIYLDHVIEATTLEEVQPPPLPK